MPSRYAVHLDAGLGPQTATPEGPLPDRLLPIALIGDFSGRARRGNAVAPDLAARRPIRIDRDSVDAVLARLAPEIPLSPGASGAGPTAVRFKALDDFLPDSLYDRLPVFEALRTMPEPRTAVPEGEVDRGARPAAREAAAPSALDMVKRGDLLSQAVAATLGESAGAPADELQAFVRRVVAPHLVREAEPGERAWRAAVAAASGALLREILHDPGVHALEALWRAVDFVVRRVDSAAEPPFYLLDLSQAEAAADLSAVDRVEDSLVFRLLVDPPGGVPGGRWAAFASAFTFAADPADAELAGRLAALACSAGAPWLGAAGASLAGCPSLLDCPDPSGWDGPVGAAWTMLRRRPEAAWLGLALPRPLLRLPYGPDTEPCERLDFRETDSPPRHEQYLWGPPAFACALVLAGQLGPAGHLRPSRGVLEIPGMPLHLYEAEGQTRAQPCAEVLLSERAAHRLLDVGLMPLVSLKDRDAVRLLRFQSVAEPATALAGPWGGPGRA
jgi:type VI secretion system protein ImpC